MRIGEDQKPWFERVRPTLEAQGMDGETPEAACNRLLPALWKTRLTEWLKTSAEWNSESKKRVSAYIRHAKKTGVVGIS